MKFHHQGYVSGDPRIQPAAGTGIDRPDDLPEQVDVLIVGAGPAGMLAAAQLAQFPDITTRIVDRRPGRLQMGQADGIQPRSVETFQAFGFADRIVAEGCLIIETAFWTPGAQDRSRIVRRSRVLEDPNGVSEFPHITVNQARVLDYFAEAMAQAPTRMKPDWGLECQSLDIAGTGDHPVTVTLAHTDGPRKGQTRTVRARYVVGADGARSGVRGAIGCTATGDRSHHAWGVMDVLAVTDFPDIRVKCAIQSDQAGSILLIPREGGHMVRLYVDLGDVDPNARAAVRQTTAQQVIDKARKILHPYTLDVREVAWYSVYEVGHSVCDRFDDVPPQQAGTRAPRVFIAGDASHTHSAKAGQGMNVSMQDGFNLGWKLAHVLQGRSPAGLLATYSAERQRIGQDIIAFDRRWASIMAKPPGDARHQGLATGYPIGKRFRSAIATRVADGAALHIGHQARADGRWRIDVFADAAPAGADSPVAVLAEWLVGAAQSPLHGFTPAGLDSNAWFDLRLIYQQPHTEVDLGQVPAVFLPRIGAHGLIDYDGVWAVTPGQDIFEARGIDRQGAIVLVRPDQYVAHVLPLTATDALGAFISGFTLPQR